MSRRFWLNLILLLVVVVLVLVIGYQPKPGNSTQPLFVTAAYQASDIRIQRMGKADIHIQRQQNEWQLLEPGFAPVNSERIKLLLTVLQEPVIATYNPEGKDLSAFGLDPGKIKLTINEEEATFGSTNPVTLNRYILKNRKIYTIREIVYGVLGTSVTSFLTHRLLPEGTSVIEVEAPALLSHLSGTVWRQMEARDIADMTGDETILGKVKLTVQSSDIKQEKHLIELGIIAIKPLLVLGRSDLQVKYTFDLRMEPGGSLQIINKRNEENE